MTCAIVGAGEFGGFLPEYSADYIIAADGGYDRLAEFGIKPDLLVGDFDSIKVPRRDIPNSVQTLAFPKEKDKTDIELAVDEAEKRGFKKFYIYGGLGGRVDHTLANIFLIARYGAYLIGENAVITSVKNGEIGFGADKKGVVSVFAFGGDAAGVTEKGLKYPLDNAVLKSGSTLGVSNEFIGEESVISVKSGCLIIIAELPE